MIGTPFNQYERNESAGAAPRMMEARAFHKAARLLTETDDLQSRLRAISFNRRLWTLVQAEVTDSANSLPGDIKAKLLSLSMFMDKALTGLAQGHSQQIAAMVDVNRAIAASQMQKH